MAEVKEVTMTILAIVGMIVITRIILQLLSFLNQYFIHKFSYVKYKSEWAVITGASAGIGAGMAKALARKGINLILIARTQSKLQAIADECSNGYGVTAKIVSFDFSSATPEDFQTLYNEEIKPLSPTILINNVGINVEFPTDFKDMTHDEISNIVKVNINSTNIMTSYLLPEMINKSRGIIICLSSAGGAVTPAPMLACYAGTKAYNDSFAVSLSGEVSKYGVNVHSLTPFFVESAMAKMRRSIKVPSADHFAGYALNMVGCGTPRLQPYFIHKIMQTILTKFPLKMQVDYIDGLHRNMRKRALKKKGRLSAAAKENMGATATEN